MPTPVQEAQYRRDWARWRTRRLSWLIGGGAATGSVVLGALFSQLLPGHSAAAVTRSGAPAGGGSPAGRPTSAPASASATPTHHHRRQHRAAASQAPAPAPAPAQAPQVVSGGS